MGNGINFNIILWNYPLHILAAKSSVQLTQGLFEKVKSNPNTPNEFMVI